MASDLGRHCLSMSHKKDATLIWVKTRCNIGVQICSCPIYIKESQPQNAELGRLY